MSPGVLSSGRTAWKCEPLSSAVGGIGSLLHARKLGANRRTERVPDIDGFAAISQDRVCICASETNFTCNQQCAHTSAFASASRETDERVAPCGCVPRSSQPAAPGDGAPPRNSTQRGEIMEKGRKDEKEAGREKKNTQMRSTRRAGKGVGGEAAPARQCQTPPGWKSIACLMRLSKAAHAQRRPRAFDRPRRGAPMRTCTKQTLHALQKEKEKGRKTR